MRSAPPLHPPPLARRCRHPANVVLLPPPAALCGRAGGCPERRCGGWTSSRARTVAGCGSPTPCLEPTGASPPARPLRWAQRAPRHLLLVPARVMPLSPHRPPRTTLRFFRHRRRGGRVCGSRRPLRAACRRPRACPPLHRAPPFRRRAVAACVGVHACACPVAPTAVVLGGRRAGLQAPAGGVARASSMRARTVGVKRGPSATRPPSTVAAASSLRAARASAAPAVSASASATFISSGYAAAAAARAAPCPSRPCATSACPSVPCVHRASRSRRTCASSAGEKARVVYFRVCAPRAHWAHVKKCAWTVSSASLTRG
eukprot:6214419-Pleurochrysis_carterae.AAC.2